MSAYPWLNNLYYPHNVQNVLFSQLTLLERLLVTQLTKGSICINADLSCPATQAPSDQPLVKEQKQFPSNAVLTFRLTIIFLFLTTLNTYMFQTLMVHDQGVH